MTKNLSLILSICIIVLVVFVAEDDGPLEQLSGTGTEGEQTVFASASDDDYDNLAAVRTDGDDGVDIHALLPRLRPDLSGRISNRMTQRATPGSLQTGIAARPQTPRPAAIASCLMALWMKPSIRARADRPWLG